MDIAHLGNLLGSVAAMSAFTAGIVGFIRGHWLTKMDGMEVVAFAVLVAFVTTGSLVWLAHFAAWGFLAVAAFSLISAVWAAGTIKVGKAFLSGPIEKTVLNVVLPMLEKLLAPNVTVPSGDPTAQTSTDASGATVGNSSGPSSPSSG